MSGSQASTEIMVRSSTSLAALDEFDGIIRGEIEAPVVVDDPEAISREIIDQLLAAESDDELQMGKALSWRDDLLGVPVEIHGFRWRPSTIEGGQGLPVFVIVSLTRLDSGDRVVATTGAANVLAQLSNMARRGTLNSGQVWKLVEADAATARGFKPLWLVKLQDSNPLAGV